MNYDPRPDNQNGVPLFIPLAASSVLGFFLVAASAVFLHIA